MENECTKKTLVIAFNKFRAGACRYYEVTEDREEASCEIDELSDEPTAAIYDEVMETGEGEYNSWNAHKAVELRSHPLLKH